MSDNIFNDPYTTEAVRRGLEDLDLRGEHYREWMRTNFRKFNAEHFGGTLVEPEFRDLQELGTLGLYQAKANVLSMDWRLIDLVPDMALDTLLHEMVHEFTYPDFKRAMNRPLGKLMEIMTNGHGFAWEQAARERGVKSIPAATPEDAKRFARALYANGMIRDPQEDMAFQALLAEGKDNVVTDA